MKVQCDVCGKKEASVFCCADEAALCDTCDSRVHRANKLAEKHRRFSLLRPSSGQDHPICDVCQERKAFVFCQEDRAILCKDCDDSIHGSNDLTMKHNRFLLAGVRMSVHPLSSSSDSDSTSSQEEREEQESVPRIGNRRKDATVARIGNNRGKPAPVTENPILTNFGSNTNGSVNPVASNNGSSISEYLIKVCPGWRVDELLVDDAAAAAAAAASGNGLMPFLEADLESNGLDLPMWVPQPPEFPPATAAATAATAAQLQSLWQVGPAKEMVGPTMKAGRERWAAEDLFAVPQISPREANPPGKRARPPIWYY